ncbi:MAG TPA: hypothetical protein VN238_13615 [Solirubrobacteraceae bacterium]|nr:hypothetical protein [Solirubrobacteraceae bacterium]
MSRILLAAAAIALALALACLAPAGVSARSLVPAGATSGVPYSDGTALVWQAPDGALERRVPGSGRTDRLPLAHGCTLQDVADSGVALLRCSPDTLDVIETRTGRLLGRLGFDGLPPTASRVGRLWVEAMLTRDCYHCETWVAVNWRTGERREVGSYSDEPALDLDQVRPRAFSEAWQDGDGRVDVVMWGGENHFRVFRDRRLVRTVRADVHFSDEMFVVSRGRVAWIEADEPGGVPDQVRELQPVSGRVRSWPVAGVPGGRSSSALVLRVGADLVYAVPVRPRIPHGRYRVLRAR